MTKLTSKQKKIAFGVVMGVFNVYLLWPAATPARVYKAKADSVVYVERFASPVFKMEIVPGIVMKIKMPWSARYGHGSGVIISKKGHVLTAGHVAEGSGLFLITMKGGQVYEAGVLAVDPNADLAILQPVRGGPRGYSVAHVRTGASVGDPVVHIGNPLGFRSLLSTGVVSLLYPYVMISDTVINPGSSGGALFDIRGRLVGIAVAIISPIQAYIGHSIFVGPDEIKRFVDQWKCTF